MSLAPLPTLDDCKLVCKIDLGDPSLDGLIAAYMAAAESIVQQRTNVPIQDQQYVQTDRTLGVQPTASFSSPQAFLLNRRPINRTIAPIIAGFDGTVVDATTYTVDHLAGIIYANLGISFSQGPYTITYNAGLVNHPDWAARYRAIVAQAIRDLVAWMYEQADPAVHSEGAGGGVSITFDPVDCPRRICFLLSALPGGGVVLGI